MLMKKAAHHAGSPGIAELLYFPCVILCYFGYNGKTTRFPPSTAAQLQPGICLPAPSSKSPVAMAAGWPKIWISAETCLGSGAGT